MEDNKITFSKLFSDLEVDTTFDGFKELNFTINQEVASLTPEETRELIAHLTNCLKEVENG